MLKKDKSEALTKEYNKYYPGGHSNLRIPMDVTEHRLFIAKSDGTHLTDVDGNEYIEYNGSMGPNILGHKNPNFVKKVVEYIENNGTAIGSNLLFSPMDVEVAKRLSELIPCVEELKFTVTGSEAVQAAFRIMRAYTGKNVIVRFQGNYAGWGDNVLGGRINSDVNAEIPFTDFSTHGGPEEDPYYTEGRSPLACKETIMIPWNNFEVLEETFDKYHDIIAGIHFEGIVWNHEGLYPKPGFVEKIRELCTKYNIVMCMAMETDNYNKEAQKALEELPETAMTKYMKLVIYIREKKLYEWSYDNALDFDEACKKLEEIVKLDEKYYKIAVNDGEISKEFMEYYDQGDWKLY